MTILSRANRLGVTCTLVGVLLAVCCATEPVRAGEVKKAPPVEFDREAVIVKIDVAIAKAVDPKLKNVLSEMRKCAGRRFFRNPYLDLRNKQLTTLPPEIGLLTNLSHLWLDGNELTALPPEIGKLTNLKQLELRNNKLTTLPSEVGLLSNLTELFLEDNQLATLPPEFWKLTKLKDLKLN